MNKKFLAMLLAFIFFMSGSQAYGQTGYSAVSAGNAAASDTVATAEELIEWVQNHYATGGRVTLTDNIVFSGKGTYLDLDPSQDLSVYVDMQGYSITVSCSPGLYLRKGFHFYGEGVTSPLFTIDRHSRLNIFDSSITAFGNEYHGGTAVSLTHDVVFYCDGGRIQAYGTNSVAVSGQGEPDIVGSYIEASGDGAVAISGAMKLKALYSIVSGSALAIVNTRAEESIDTCVLYPATDKEQITRRYFLPADQQTKTLEVVLNDPSQLVSTADTRKIYLINTNDPDDADWEYIPVEWEPVVPDTSILGETSITGRLCLERIYPYKVIEMLAKQAGVDTLDTAVYLTIKVVEPRKPEVLETTYNGDGFGIYMRDYINRNLTTVLFTDDLGETWKDITSKVMFTGGELINVWDLLPDTVYGFQIIAGGSGVVQGASDIFAVKLNNISMKVENLDPRVLNGGDRGGTSAEPQTDNRDKDSNNDNLYDDNNQDSNRDNDSNDDSIYDGNNQDSYEKDEPSVTKDSNGTVKPSVSWSGSRLKDQITANPETVTFINDGVKADISSKALLNLNISDSQRLNIIITKPANNQFIVDISRDNVPIISLPLRVTVDYKLAASANTDCLVVINEKGQVIPLSGFDKQAGKIVALLDHPGSYKIVEKKPAAFADTSSSLSESVNFLSVRGIVNGYPDGNFRPAEPMNNSEFITMLARAFSDALPVSDGKWYEPYINWAIKAGLAPKTVNPEKPLTAWDSQQYFNGLATHLDLEKAPLYVTDGITAGLTRLQGTNMLGDFVKSILSSQ